MLFPNFEADDMVIDDLKIHFVRGGKGPGTAPAPWQSPNPRHVAQGRASLIGTLYCRCRRPKRPRRQRQAA